METNFETLRKYYMPRELSIDEIWMGHILTMRKMALIQNVLDTQKELLIKMHLRLPFVQAYWNTFGRGF